MIFGATGANTDSLSARAQTAYQGFAPMSRSFTSAILNDATIAAEGWSARPEIAVVGIDEGLITVGDHIGNLVSIGLEDGFPQPCATGACSAAVTNGISALAVLISGMPSSGTVSMGTTAECSDPCRTCLVDFLGGAAGQAPGNGRIDHIYRRDDKSGTQDTFREKIVDGCVGGACSGNNPVKFWCNGKSEGNNSLPGGNIKNEDLDPIRRGCAPEVAGLYSYSRCTYYPLAYTCTNGDPILKANSSVTVPEPTGSTWDDVNKKWVETTGSKTYVNPLSVDISCTQGLLVALSESDPFGSIGDINISIGNRVGLDPWWSTMGMAGLLSSAVAGSDAVNINTITNDRGNVYPGAYKFWRRLYFQRNPTFVDTNGICTANRGNATVAPCDTRTGRSFEESLVLAWAANDCNLSPIVTAAGFLDKLAYGCSDNCTSGSGSQQESAIVTCIPPGYGVGTPKQNVGAKTETCPTCNGSDGKTYPFVGDGKSYGGCPNQAQTNACAVGVAPYPASTYP
jgi:hypothetical protein